MTKGQTVLTPIGPGTVLMNVESGVVVTQIIRARDLSISECRRRRPQLLRMSMPQFLAWQRDAYFTNTESFPLDQITVQ